MIKIKKGMILSVARFCLPQRLDVKAMTSLLPLFLFLSLSPFLCSSETFLFSSPHNSVSVIEMQLVTSQVLIQRGHKVIFVTYEDYAKKVRATGAEFVSLGSFHIPIETQYELFSKISDPDPYKGISTMKKYLFTTYMDEYPVVNQLFEQRKGEIDYCYVDHFALATMDLCVKNDVNMGIFFGLSLGFLGLEDTADMPDYLFGGQLSSVTFFHRFINFVHFLKGFLFHMVPFSNTLNEARENFKMTPIMDPLTHYQHRIVITPVFFGLEYPRKISPFIHNVGFIHHKNASEYSIFNHASQERNDVIQWLEEGEYDAAVYVAMGSIAQLRQSQWDTFLETFAEMPNTKFIVSLRDMKSTPKGVIGQKVTTPLNLPANVLVRGWMPQKRLLAHPLVSCFITHGGLSSLSEAIQGETPVIVLPFFGDQPANAARVVDSGMGLRLNLDFSKEEAIKKIKQVTEDKNGHFKWNTQRLGKLSEAAGGVERAATILELDARYGSGHLQQATESVIIRNNLDVKFVIVLLFFSPLVVLFFNKKKK